MSVKIERRQFLKLLGAGVVAVATLSIPSCAPIPEHSPSQGNFVAGLKKRLREDGGLDLRPETSLADIRSFIATKTFTDNTWMANDADLGTIQSPARGPIKIATVNGEMASYKIDKGFFYPTPEATMAQFIKIPLEGNTDVYVYGTNGTQGRFNKPENKQILSLFAKDFFKDSKAGRKILHLNFMPIGSGFKPLEVPPDKWKQEIENYDAATFTQPDFVTQQVLLNMNKLHIEADFFGFNPRDMLVGALANENVNMIARSDTRKAADKSNEAPSTIFDLLSHFDPEIARKILGENYYPFVLLVETEMKIMKEAQRKQLIEAYLQGDFDKMAAISAPFIALGMKLFSPQQAVDLQAWKFAHI